MSGDGPVLPLGLRVGGRRVVVVGGGPVGLRRVTSLLDAGADVHAAAGSTVDSTLKLLPAFTGAAMRA